jgi:hypothetical protein
MILQNLVRACPETRTVDPSLTLSRDFVHRSGLADLDSPRECESHVTLTVEFGHDSSPGRPRDSRSPTVTAVAPCADGPGMPVGHWQRRLAGDGSLRLGH